MKANRTAEIKKLLLMRVEVEDRNSKIKIINDIICSGQRYRRGLDPDMSDVAISFYECIYPNIPTPLLDDDGELSNESFAGDTMNSFNSIANKTPDAGSSAKARQKNPRENWPDYLQKYYEQYHCLANFWVLPMSLGRQGKKTNYWDSMDMFLANIKQEAIYQDKLGSTYCNVFRDYESFCESHSLPGYTPDDPLVYTASNAKKLVSQATKRMELRAEKLAEKCDDRLQEYFSSLGLM